MPPGAGFKAFLQTLWHTFHQEVKTVPLPWNRAKFCDCSLNKMQWKWYCVTSETRLEGYAASAWVSLGDLHLHAVRKPRLQRPRIGILLIVWDLSQQLELTPDTQGNRWAQGDAGPLHHVRTPSWENPGENSPAGPHSSRTARDGIKWSLLF